MKYIKGLEIIETPRYTEVDGIQIELSDSQLRFMGYIPIDEVIMEQAEKLANTVPSEEDIKEKLVNKLSILIPGDGLPYKLGYTWEPKIEGNCIVFESVRDSNGVGTNNNPIIFADYVMLIPNAFYLYEGELYVYVGIKGKATNWDSCKDFMELM